VVSPRSMTTERARASPALAAYSHVSVIRIDNAMPTRDNVRNGSYSFWIVEHLYAGMQPTALAKDFLDFLAKLYRVESAARLHCLLRRAAIGS
jgi:hypothetical protein